MMNDSDVLTVAKVREGDLDAFRLLVERHSQNLFRLCYRMTGSEMDAEDLVQETFLRVYRSLNTFQDKAGFSTWIYRIAINCSMDWLRKRRPYQDIDEYYEQSEERGQMKSNPEAHPDRMVLNMELRARVRSAMEQLSPSERAAFVLRHFEGMTIEEISAALGLRSGAAKHSIFRAVRKMRRALAPMMGLTE